MEQQTTAKGYGSILAWQIKRTSKSETGFEDISIDSITVDCIDNQFVILWFVVVMVVQFFSVMVVGPLSYFDI